MLLVATASSVQAAILTVGPPGSGAQFDEIQAAIDAAQSDDVILVRPGTYAGIVVTKPVRILGDGTGTVRIDSAQPDGAMIQGIGGGEELVLSGVRVEGTPAPFTDGHAVRVAGCAGTVVLHDVVVDPGPDQIGVRLEDCERVVMLSCRIRGAGTAGTAAVHATSATLWIAGTEVVGLSPADDLHQLRSGAHALEVEDATLRVWRSTLLGGDGNVVSLEAFGSPALGGAGIAADNSVVDLYGGPPGIGGEVRGGDGGAAPFFGLSYDGAPGVDLENGSVARIQANLPVAGGFDGSGTVQAPAVRTDGSSSFALDPLVFPTLAGDKRQLAIGGSLGLTLEGNPSATQVLFVSLGTGPDVVLSGVAGVGLLDSSAFFQVAVVVLPPSGATSLALGVPALHALLGRTFFFQAAEAFGLQLSFSNPLLATVTT